MSASCVIYTVDLSNMGAFYEQCFGLVTVDRDDSYRVLESEAWELTLVRVPSRIAATIEITDPPRRRGESPVKLTFAVASIAATRAAASQLGGQIDPADTEWVFRDSLRCDGIDPEGNVILLRQFGSPNR